MLCVGHSAARITRGVASVVRNDALLPLSEQQQYGMSMLRALGGREHPSANNSAEHVRGSRTGRSSSSKQSGHSSSTSCSNLYASGRELSFAVSAARLASPKRLMSTAARGSIPPTGNTGASGAAVGGVGPDELAGAADAAMAAASTADQVRLHASVYSSRSGIYFACDPSIGMFSVCKSSQPALLDSWEHVVLRIYSVIFLRVLLVQQCKGRADRWAAGFDPRQ